MRFPDDYLKVKPTDLSITSGRLLISVPFFNDPFFNRTVLLLTDYSKDSSAGLVLNKESEYVVSKVASDIKVDDSMFIGGPVMASTVFCVHNHAANNENIFKLLPGVYLGYDEMFLALIEHKAIETIRYKFFVGYSGWAKGQLEEEVEQKMWIVANANPELIFETPPEKIWETAIRQLGNDYLHWLNIPEDISDN